jgi:hypothetical protein
MTSPTKRDVIEAAMSTADDATQGRLKPSDLEHQAVAECRELFGTVAGPDDPLWPLHIDITRQVLALDGVHADELAEWLAVARQRAGQPVIEPDPLPESEPLPSEALILNSAAHDADAEGLADAEAAPEPVAGATPVTPPRRADRYDPFAGWSPRRSLR